MRSLIILGLYICIPSIMYAQKISYATLYTTAHTWGDTQPDSAIFYAQKAVKATQKDLEKADAHNLLAYNAQKMGYYGLAVMHYRKAYQLYADDPHEKIAMLHNMANCYKSIGQVKEAMRLAKRVIHAFGKHNDSIKLCYTLNLLANCHREITNYNTADSLFRLLLHITKRLYPENLSNIFNDLANLKAKVNQYDSCVYYQKLAIARSNDKDLVKQDLYFIRLAHFYLLKQKPDSAKYCLQQTKNLTKGSTKAAIYYHAAQGLLHFIARKEVKAKLSYQKCDSLLTLLRKSSNYSIQQKFARKIAFDVYQNGYNLLGKIWIHDNKHLFSSPKDWFKKRMLQEQEHYQGLRVQLSLKDSLVMERTTPKTKVIKKITPWWWIMVVTALSLSGMLVYQKREKTLKANTNFIQSLTDSPIKGFDQPTSQEIRMLEHIESLIGKKLKIDDIKILLMISRRNTYNQISLATGIANGSIKTRVKRLKDKCNVDNIRDLM